MPIQTYPAIQADIQQLILAPEAECVLLAQLQSESNVHMSYLFGTYDACTGSAFVSVVLPLPAAGIDARAYAKGGLDIFRQFCSDAQCLGMWMRTADLQPISTDTLLSNVAKLDLGKGLLLGVGQQDGRLTFSAVGVSASGTLTALPIVVDR